MCFDRMNTCRQKQMQPPGAAASVSDISSASDEELLYVIFVESVSALGAEFRGILGILRLPAALVAAVKRRVGGLFRSALGAELALVHRSAGAGPALGVVAVAPHLHFQLFAGFGSGFFAPHSGQNLPFTVAPQAHFQPLADAAGADCC